MESNHGVPAGFSGCVDTHAELIPDGAKVVRLPEEGIVDGPFVRIPPGEFDAIVVSGLVESLGRLESFVAAAAEQLRAGGQLIIDMENLAAPRSVKFVLEGRPSSLDPFGSLAEPERRVHKPRVVTAIESAGLLLQDTYLVPSRTDVVGPDFLRTIFREGFLALPYLAGLPPARVWLQARKLPVLAGSVLVGPGTEAASAATTRALQEFLPADWEIVPAGTDGADSEPAAFNRGLSASRGEVIWFLRAGATGDAGLFHDLLARTTISPAAPGAENEVAHAGDVSGLMMLRSDVFTVGPLGAEFGCPQILYEDWLLRLEAAGKRTFGVAGSGYVHAELPVPELETFRTESVALMDKWNELDLDQSGFASDDSPICRAHADRPVPWAGREPRLSLCMITKNEERFLEQCLRSAAPIVDEIIIVDTGSDDRTVEIAEGFGAQVLHYEWNDDFASARNVAREAATGDWILSLDADEALRSEEHAVLRQALHDPGVSGYHLKFKNHHTFAKTAGVMMIRVFRNLEGVIWENRIHEQMTTSLVKTANEHGLRLGVTDVTVDHYGYLDEVMQSRNKDERNDRIFRAHLDDKPDDIYMLYKYGDFLRRTTSRWSEALAMLRQAFDRIMDLAPAHRTEIPYAGEIAALAALEYRRAGDENTAERIVQTALREFVCTPNLHYLAAGLAALRGRNDEAIGHYRRCLAFRDQVLVVPIQEGVTSYVSITGMAQCYLQKGQQARARRLLEQSIRIEPGYEVSTLMLSRAYLDEGDLRRALTSLTKFLDDHPNSPGVCQQAALFMKELGYTEEAQAMGRRAIELLESQSLDFEANQVREAVFATA